MLSLPSLSQNTTSAVLSTGIAIITNPTRQVNPFTSEHSPSGDLGLPVSDVQDQNLDSVDSVVWFHDSGTYIVQVSSVFIYVGMYCYMQIDFQVLLHKSALFVSREQYCNGYPAVTIFANFVKNNEIMISLFCFSWGLNFMKRQRQTSSLVAQGLRIPASSVSLRSSGWGRKRCKNFVSSILSYCSYLKPPISCLQSTKYFISSPCSYCDQWVRQNRAGIVRCKCELCNLEMSTNRSVCLGSARDF